MLPIFEKVYFQIIFASPESLLSTLTWKRILLEDTYKSNLFAVVVDEAHCVKSC